MTNKVMIILTCLLLVIGAYHPQDGLPYYNSPDFTPSWKDEPISGHRIPAFSFTDQDNLAVSDKTFDEKIYIANFFFTSCSSICPRMMANLLKVQKAFPVNDQIAFLSHTVTPWADSAGRLKEYAQKFGMDKRWHLVTGDKAAIYRIARQSYFAEEEQGFFNDSTEFLHTEHVLLIDRNKHIRGVYNGTLELEIDRLIGDVKELLRE